MGRAQRRQAERDQRKANRTEPGSATLSVPRAQVAEPRSGKELGSVMPRERGKEPGAPSTPAVFATGIFSVTPSAVAIPDHAASGGPPLPAPERLPAHGLADTGLLEITGQGWPIFAEVEPQALGLTYWFEAEPDGEPYAVTVRFSGRLADRRGEPGEMDDFVVEETIDRVLPGSGRIALTTRVEALTAGQWTVRAHRVAAPQRARDGRAGTRRPRGAGPASPVYSASGTTGWAPMIRELAPGVHIGAWPALVAVGAITALSIQTLLATRAALPITQVLVLSGIACLVGLIGAKLYYLVQRSHDQHARARTGMCLQGFVLAALATMVAGALIAGISIGPLLDISAPGLAIGMAIGRIGCFFAGCCVGRPTASRWGRWSSNRRLGLRRVPVQLVESAVALLIAVAALAANLTTTVHPAGVVFVAVIASYTLARQVLFPLRDLPRKTALGRLLTTALSGVVLISDITLALLQ